MFYFLNEIRDCSGPRESTGDMDMIFDSADPIRMASVFRADTCDVRVKFWLYFLDDDFSSVLCAEYDM